MDKSEISESEIDTKKQLEVEFKTFIKTNSKDYAAKLKSELMKGLQNHFSKLTAKVEEEFKEQQTTQAKDKEKIEEEEQKNTKLKKVIKNRLITCFKEKVLQNETQLKLKAFTSLKMYSIFKMEKRKRAELFMKIIKEKKIRKIFNVLKEDVLFAKTSTYQDKIKVRGENEMVTMENEMKQKKDKMWELIHQAEEKLKHENRKKIQVKLMLDQMVLRGISALNMQAMTLSQGSLQGIICLFNIIFNFYE